MERAGAARLVRDADATGERLFAIVRTGGRRRVEGWEKRRGASLNLARGRAADDTGESKYQLLIERCQTIR
jgi:hypothetical protein